MKKISIIGLLSMSLVAGLTTTSCEDMMTIDTDLNTTLQPTTHCTPTGVS